MADENKAKITVTAVDETKEAFKSAQESLDKFKEHGEALNGMVAKLLPALGAAGFTEIIAQSAEAADHLNKLSVKTGLTVEAVNGLSYAAKLSDVDTDAMAKSVQKLSIYMANAEITGGKQADMLTKLGITSKDPMQAMYQLSDALKSIEDPAQRVYVATQLMGKGGADMIPALIDGGDALKKMVEEGQAINPVTAAFAAQSEQLNDNLERMKIRAQGTATVLAEGIVPAVNDVVQVFIDMTGNGHQAAEVIGKGIGDALRGVAIVGGLVVASFRDVGNWLGFLAAEAVALAHGDLDAMKAISAERDKQAAEIDADYDKFRDKILNVGAASAEAGEKAKKMTIDLADGANGNKAFESLAARIRKMTEEFKAYSDTGRQVTETEKMRLDMMKQIETGTLDISAAQKKQLESLLGVMGAAEHHKIQMEQEKAARVEAQKTIEKAQMSSKELVDQLKFENSMIGQNALEVQVATEKRKIDLNLQKELLALKENDKFKNRAADKGVDDEYKRAVKGAQDAAEASKKGAEEELRARDAVNKSWETGATKAMNDYQKAANDTAAQSAKVWSDGLNGMSDALSNFAKTGKLDFSKMADSIISDLIRIQMQKAVSGMAGSMFGGGSAPTMAAANGAAFDGGVQAFAQGGIVGSPTLFKFASGGQMQDGLMGEAGPEAIMPLQRGPDGRLGVTMHADRDKKSGGSSIVVNVVLDSQGQAAVTGNDQKMGDLGKKIGDVARQTILDEMRPGGILAQAGVHA